MSDFIVIAPMVFVKCLECGDFVAINASKCLNCGCPKDKIKIPDIKKNPNTIQCLECGQFISLDEENCPNCGCTKQRIVSLLVRKVVLYNSLSNDTCWFCGTSHAMARYELADSIIPITTKNTNGYHKNYNVTVRQVVPQCQQCHDYEMKRKKFLSKCFWGTLIIPIAIVGALCYYIVDFIIFFILIGVFVLIPFWFCVSTNIGVRIWKNTNRDYRKLLIHDIDRDGFSSQLDVYIKSKFYM